MCDTDTGAVLREGRAPHPGLPEPGRPIPEIDPEAWLRSLGAAARGGLLEGVRAIGVTAPSQGLVALDAGGVLIRPALLRQDQRSASSAVALVDEGGGASFWTDRVGGPPTAASTVAKLRWLAVHEPMSAHRVAEILQPHDWLVWQLLGRPARRTTDRGEASATGYWSPITDQYAPELLALALGRPANVPQVLSPAEPAGASPEGLLIAAGTGTDMATALGLGTVPGDVVISLGATGSVFAVHHEPLPDPSGLITPLADATGRHLPTVSTLNAAHVLRATAGLLGTDAEGLSELALRSTPGAYGLVLLPYLKGERAPRLPHAAGTLTGLREESMAPEHFARAAVEGMLCGIADALDVLRSRGVTVRRVFLTGSAGRLAAVQTIAPLVFGVPVIVPSPGEYAARGAARQAAWALAGSAAPPAWPLPDAVVVDPGGDATAGVAIRRQYASARGRIHPETA